MTTLREAAQQALEALEVATTPLAKDRQEVLRAQAAITALRAALAEPVQEPFCYVYEYDSPYGLHREFYPREYNGMKPSRTVPLFTAPPQRQPLTEEELDVMSNAFEEGYAFLYRSFARAVERAHGIKE